MFDPRPAHILPSVLHVFWAFLARREEFIWGELFLPAFWPILMFFQTSARSTPRVYGITHIIKIWVQLTLVINVVFLHLKRVRVAWWKSSIREPSQLTSTREG